MQVEVEEEELPQTSPLRRSARKMAEMRAELANLQDWEGPSRDIENEYGRRYPKRVRRGRATFGSAAALHDNNGGVHGDGEQDEEEEEEEEEEEMEEPILRRTSRERKPINRLEYAIPLERGSRRKNGTEEQRRGGERRHRGPVTFHDRVDTWMRRFKQNNDSDCEVSDRGIGGSALGGAGVVWRPDVPLDVIEKGLGGIGSGALKKAVSEVTSVQVDPTITWDLVGGLGEYVKAIKEMVFLPLVYPEIFSRFHIAPPRGLLLYGPPGTGKTLLARALAASASRAGKAVSFFMRKGADVLSKWVGESEKQLRTLFEEAQKQQPSIIFFDEIDGLAPVRNGKQDQIHNSIVSTLLALMDGLDSRGQVIVIGATNRIDAIDGALRRPGRFDREFLVPLPTIDARESILEIHTRKWTEKPAPSLLKRLAEDCVGYSGADLKALCTEAAIRSLRRCFPQIYDREERLLVDASTIKVDESDFADARRGITPAAHRSAVQHARPIPSRIEPCLRDTMRHLLHQVVEAFPVARPSVTAYQNAGNGARNKQQEQQLTLATDGRLMVEADVGGAIVGRLMSAETAAANGTDDEIAGTSHGALDGVGTSSGMAPDQALHLWAMIAEASRMPVAGSRLLITGDEGQGQVYIGSALLHALEAFPCHPIGLPTLLADDMARSPEEALVRRITEARRAAPAVLFLPHLQMWWDAAAHSNLRATLWMLLEDLPPDLPLFLLATADVSEVDVDPIALDLFGSNVMELQAPNEEDRHRLFASIKAAMMTKPARREHVFAEPPPDLPLAPAQPTPRTPTELQQRMQAASEEASVRQLRVFLRDKVLLKLLNDRRWTPFSKPLQNMDPDATFSNPMDLSTMLWNLDEGKYPTLDAFQRDVRAIVDAMREYVGDAIEAARIVSRAHSLQDTVDSMLAGIDQSLVQKCDEIAARGGPVKVVKTRGKDEAPGAPEVRGERVSSRIRGQALERDVFFTDPERLVARIREQRKAEQAALVDQAEAENGGGAGDDAVSEELGRAADAPVVDANGEGEDDTAAMTDVKTEADFVWPPESLEESAREWLSEIVSETDNFSVRMLEREYGYVSRELEISRQQDRAKDATHVDRVMKLALQHVRSTKAAHERRRQQRCERFGGAL